MPNKLYIYDKTSYQDRWQASGRFDYSDRDLYVLPIGSRKDLIDGLDRFLSGNIVFSRMLFQTHGDTGSLWTGSSSIWNVTWIEYFENRNYEKLFPTYGKIYFDGCDIGEGDEGVKFLRAAGRVFLKGMGGEVMAWTSFGFGFPGWVPFLGGHTVHATGNLVRVKFAPGDLVGTVECDEPQVILPYPGT